MKGNCVVLEYHKNPETGFYNIEKACFGSHINDNFCGKSWHRMSTPEWLKKYWDPTTQMFVGGKTQMFKFCCCLLHDKTGNYLFIPRNLINKTGNLEMYEYCLQDEKNNSMHMVKICKRETPPSTFRPTLDPKCKYDITECCRARDDARKCAERWLVNYRKKIAEKQKTVTN